LDTAPYRWCYYGALGSSRTTGVTQRREEYLPVTYYIAYEFVASFRQVMDEFCVELVVCIPRASRERDRRFKAFKHVDLSCNVLD